MAIILSTLDEAEKKVDAAAEEEEEEEEGARAGGASFMGVSPLAGFSIIFARSHSSNGAPFSTYSLTVSKTVSRRRFSSS
jgi:hypothetical protein